MGVKTYYLSGFRSIVVGMLLIAMGISMSFIGFDPGGSFWDNFQAMVIDFRSPAFFWFPY